MKGSLRGAWQGGLCRGPTGLCPAGLARGEKASRLKDTNSKHTPMPARPTAAPLQTLWPPEKSGQPLAACPPPPRHPQGTEALCPQTTPALCTCCLRAGLLKIVNLLWLKDNATHRCTAGSADTSSGMRHLCSNDNSCLDLQVVPVQGATCPYKRAPWSLGSSAQKTPSQACCGCQLGGCCAA